MRQEETGISDNHNRTAGKKSANAQKKRRNSTGPALKKAGGGRTSAHTTEKGRALKDEREIVLLALLSHEKNDTFSNVLVRQTLDACGDRSTAEKAFIKRLLEGVIERKTELDARIESFTGRSVTRLHPVVHQILRMGIYQIYYMDAVPDSAACNESVRLARRHGPARLSGFVNGVLRNAAREAAADKKEGAFPAVKRDAQGTVKDGSAYEAAAAQETAESRPGPADPVQRLSLTYSMPPWLVSMWMEQLGAEETEKLLDALMEIRPVSVRLSGRLTENEREDLLAKLRTAGVEIEKGRWLSACLHLRRTSDLRRLPGFSQGLWTVQDESSMLAVEAAGLKGGETVLDICAAPGGKSFYAADRLQTLRKDKGRQGIVYSYDLTRRKTDRIREGAERLGLDNICVGERDARNFFAQDAGKADLVLCDLPCSGLGVIGKKRDIKYRASREGLDSLQQLQRQILVNAVRYLKAGGVLIYSTCTINRAENEDNAAWIEEKLGLEPENLAGYVPDDLPGIEKNRVQLLPHVHGTDGFFISRFRKAGRDPEDRNTINE